MYLRKTVEKSTGEREEEEQLKRKREKQEEKGEGQNTSQVSHDLNSEGR
jgi:hypothetical protein